MATRLDQLAGIAIGFGSFVASLIIALIIWGTSLESLVYCMTIACLLAVALMVVYFRFYRTRYYKNSDWGDVIVFQYAVSTGLIVPLLLATFAFHVFH